MQLTITYCCPKQICHPLIDKQKGPVSIHLNANNPLCLYCESALFIKKYNYL